MDVDGLCDYSMLSDVSTFFKKQHLWLVLQLRPGVESGRLNCDAICHGKTPDQMVGIISSKEICIYSVCSYFYVDVRNCI